MNNRRKVFFWTTVLRLIQWNMLISHVHSLVLLHWNATQILPLTQEVKVEGLPAIKQENQDTVVVSEKVVKIGRLRATS